MGYRVVVRAAVEDAVFVAAVVVLAMLASPA